MPVVVVPLYSASFVCYFVSLHGFRVYDFNDSHRLFLLYYS
jgi:hypothetical protein